jgi:hypothetical protein
VIAISLAILMTTSTLAADELRPVADKEREQRRTRFLEHMRALAVATNVRYEQGDRQLKLVDSPVFRYDDQPRRFLDATIWAWTDNGRPVAFQKVEAMPQAWQLCFTSLSNDLLKVEWNDSRRYHTTEPGLAMRPLPDAPNVPARSSRRALELRNLARAFSARIVEANDSQEMRLLSTPIFEYAEPKTDLLSGAVFGFATNGTNPDLLLVLEAREEPRQDTTHWYYAAARMTTGGVTVKHRETTVAEFEPAQPRPTAFPTWTFFSIPRRSEGDQTGEGSVN